MSPRNQLNNLNPNTHPAWVQETNWNNLNLNIHPATTVKPIIALFCDREWAPQITGGYNHWSIWTGRARSHTKLMEWLWPDPTSRAHRSWHEYSDCQACPATHCSSSPSRLEHRHRTSAKAQIVSGTSTLRMSNRLLINTTTPKISLRTLEVGRCPLS